MPRIRCTAVVAAAAACAALALCGCGGKQSRLARHMARGEAYLAAGNLPKAQIEFRNALQIAPSDPQARFDLARADESLGRISEAAGLYQGVIDADPGNVRARARLAHLYLLGGAPDRALALVGPALTGHPDDPELLAVRAAVLARKGDAAGALADAGHAVRVAPTNEDAVAVLASLYQRSGQTPQAIGLITTTLAKVPGSIDLRRILAELYLIAHRPDDAAAQLEAIVGLRPDEPRYRYALAQFYVGQHRPDDAERVLKAAVAAQPGSEPKLLYADFLAQQRSPAAAERLLTDYLRQDRGNLDLRLGLARLQQRTGQLDTAVATYRGVIADEPEQPQALVARDQLAAILTQRRRFDEALALLADVLHRNPRDNDALLLRANIELARDDSSAAITDLRAVLRDQPRSVPALSTLARAQILDGEPGLAEQTLRTAVEATPQDVALRIDLSRLLVQERRADAALQVLDDGVKLAPQNVELHAEQVRDHLAAADPAAARRAADELLRVVPRSAAAAYLSGVVAQAENRPADALSAFETALSINPGAADVLAALVRLEVAQGHADQAVARLRARTDAQPGDAAAHELLGELYATTKDFAGAAQQFAQATHLAPTWPRPYEAFAQAEVAQGDVPGATRTLEAGLAATASEPALALHLAQLYEHQRRIDDAVRLYESLHAQDPRSQVVSNNLAMLLATYRADPVSLDRARELTAGFVHSQNPELLDTQGWVLLKCGDFENALPPLERAVAAAPDSGLIRYHLAMVQLKLGQRAKARDSLAAALATPRDFSGSGDARALLAQLSRG